MDGLNQGFDFPQTMWSILWHSVVLSPEMCTVWSSIHQYYYCELYPEQHSELKLAT